MRHASLPSILLLVAFPFLVGCPMDGDDPSETPEYFRIESGGEIVVCCPEDATGEILLGEVTVRRPAGQTAVVTLGFSLPAGLRVEPGEIVLDSDDPATFRVFGDCDALADVQEAVVEVTGLDGGDSPTSGESDRRTVTIRKDADCEPSPSTDRELRAADNIARVLVVDADGMAVEGAEVTVTALDGSGEAVTASSDDRGEAVLAGVPGGEVEVRAGAPGRSKLAYRTTLPRVGRTPLPDIALVSVLDGTTVTLDSGTNGTSTEVVTSETGPRLRLPEGTTIEVDGQAPAGGEVDVVVRDTGLPTAPAPMPQDAPIVVTLYVGPEGLTFDTNRVPAEPEGVGLEIPNTFGLPTGTRLELFRLEESETGWESAGSASVSDDAQWIIAEDAVLASGHFAITGTYNRIRNPTSTVTGRLLDENGFPLPYTPMISLEGETTETDASGFFRMGMDRIAASSAYQWLPSLYVSIPWRARGLSRRVGFELDPVDFESAGVVDLGDLTVPETEPGFTIVLRVLDNGEPVVSLPLELDFGEQQVGVRTDGRGYTVHRELTFGLEYYEDTSSPMEIFDAGRDWSTDPPSPYDFLPLTLSTAEGAGPDRLEILAFFDDDNDSRTGPLGANGAEVSGTDAAGFEFRGIANEFGRFVVEGVTTPLATITVRLPVDLDHFQGVVGTIVHEPEGDDGETMGVVVETVPPADHPPAERILVEGDAPTPPSGDRVHVSVWGRFSNRVTATGTHDPSTGRYFVRAPAVPSDFVYETRNEAGVTTGVQILPDVVPEEGRDVDFGPSEETIPFDRTVPATVTTEHPGAVGYLGEFFHQVAGGGATIRFPAAAITPDSSFDLRLPSVEGVEALEESGSSVVRITAQRFDDPVTTRSFRYVYPYRGQADRIETALRAFPELRPLTDALRIVAPDHATAGTPVEVTVSSEHTRYCYLYRHEVEIEEVRMGPLVNPVDDSPVVDVQSAWDQAGLPGGPDSVYTTRPLERVPRNLADDGDVQYVYDYRNRLGADIVPADPIFGRYRGRRYEDPAPLDRGLEDLYRYDSAYRHTR